MQGAQGVAYRVLDRLMSYNPLARALECMYMHLCLPSPDHLLKASSTSQSQTLAAWIADVQLSLARSKSSH